MASKRAQVRLTPRLISVAVASCFATGAAFANPTGPTVVNGTAAIVQNGNLLQITNSPKAIINWQSFSIGANEVTRFIQQSQASTVLNRVTGAGGAIDPSVILGALQSNGRVFLINPSGILFGAGAQIDVAGLVASTLKLSNADFLADRPNFTAVQGAGSVVNLGNITTGPGGNVYLVGPAVTNNGIITSPQGEVILAAGNSVELVNPGTPNLRVEIAAADNEARNLGQIVSDAGRIGIYAGLITNSGTVRADSVVSEGGRILLKGTKSVTLEDSSVLSAQGRGGGEILVLADESVRVAGLLDASAPNSGDGGFIETSASKVTIDPSAFVTTAAAYGKTGTWLIDPSNYHINPEGDITGGQLSTSLDSNNVVIHSVDGTIDLNGSGNIYVDDTVLWTSNNSLMLVAEGDIFVNQYLSTTGTGSIKLYSGWDGQGHPLAISSTPAVPNYRSIFLNAPLTTSGDVHLVAGGSISQGSAGAVITANGLLADASYVWLNGAYNMVNTLAGRSTDGEFYFTNGQSLIIGTVGPLSGITASTVNCCGADVDIRVTQGNLTVNQSVLATAGYSGEGGGGEADIYLSTQNGSIVVQNGAVISARGADVPAEGYGDGGYAYASLYAQNGSITVSNGSRVEAIGGNAVSSGYGGGANVYLSATNSITVSNATVKARGGAGAGGYSYYGGLDGGEGYISVSAGANIVVNSGSLLEAKAGDGADGGFAGVYLNAGTGISVDNSMIRANGAAGLGFTYFGSGCSAGCPGGGNGGGAYISLYNNGGSTGISVTNNSTIEAIGGPAG